MPTPHISAPDGAFAPTVLMPGDPLRAKYMAETYLSDAHLVTSVRNMYGYTGTYKGRPISIMGSGMGIPSIGIYSWELMSVYGVQNIIRIGSAGTYTPTLHLNDVVLARSAYSDSTYALFQNGCPDHVLLPSASLNQHIIHTAAALHIPLQQAVVHSSDVFYTDDDKLTKNIENTSPAEENAAHNADNVPVTQKPTYQIIRERTHTDCVEMESFALFHNANVLYRRAATLLTISDSFCTNERLSSQDRQQALTTMFQLALESAASIE